MTIPNFPAAVHLFEIPTLSTSIPRREPEVHS
jgi:hypothetical protein